MRFVCQISSIDNKQYNLLYLYLTTIRVLWYVCYYLNTTPIDNVVGRLQHGYSGSEGRSQRFVFPEQCGTISSARRRNVAVFWNMSNKKRPACMIASIPMYNTVSGYQISMIEVSGIAPRPPGSSPMRSWTGFFSLGLRFIIRNSFHLNTGCWLI